MKLTELKAGMKGKILRIDLNERSCERLLMLGIYEGADFSIERNQRRNGMIVLLVYGNFLMLRYQDAMKIEVIQDEEDRFCR